ncbi:DUF3426 domain-containing protein [Pseudoxanthomonas sp. 10H]|uniref:DUF3426 domain-containing protein n=1 Tax=Pseudoxanthomonas sp. 10H TaxID=3242729 RepID=UPI0035570237
MFVPCPHCQFLVAHPPQLRPLPAACPRCGKPLDDGQDAAAASVEESGTGLAQDSTGHAAVPVADPEEGATAPAQVDEVDPARTASPDAAAASATAPAAFAARPSRWMRWRWALIALLGLLLALQIALADRARLAADARFRPLVEVLCGALGCTLPPWTEPSAFTMLDRKVRPEPRQPGALRVDATFRNDARWAQSWPALQLALSDADGRVLGSHVFAPAQYLGRTPAAPLAPGQSAQVSFLVQEPAPGTAAFSFEFR